MCRLFGFRSVILSQVHSSLVEADNALIDQSVKHPDGWGVAYYIGDAPHLIKTASAALEDALFRKVSGIVSSLTVLAHLRRATEGDVSIVNSHPFQYGHWVFAHNGNIKNFSKHRNKLKKLIDPTLLRFILGETDSEVLFYILLTFLSKQVDLQRCLDLTAAQLLAGVTEALKAIQALVGPFEEEPAPSTDSGSRNTYLTFILTNGKAMVGHQGGQPLYYATYKRRCPERSTCPSFAPFCEAPSSDGKVNHLIFSSEVIKSQNVWQVMKPGTLIAIGPEMQLKIGSSR